MGLQGWTFPSSTEEHGDAEVPACASKAASSTDSSAPEPAPASLLTNAVLADTGLSMGAFKFVRPALQPEETTPPPPTREAGSAPWRISFWKSGASIPQECIKHAEEARSSPEVVQQRPFRCGQVLEEQRSFLGQLGIMPLKARAPSLALSTLA